MAFAAIALAITLFASAALRGIWGAERLSRNATKAVLFDGSIRRYAAMVKPPFWAALPRIEPGKGKIEIPYVGGSASGILEIDSQGDGIRLSAGGESFLLEGAELLELRSLGAFGISVSYAIGGKRYETKALFSAFPVGVGDGE